MSVSDKDNNQSNPIIEKIINFCKKNIRYITAGALVVLLIIVLAITAVRSGKTGEKEGQNQEQTQDGEETGQGREKQEAFAVDAVPEVNQLIADYYKAYAAGSVKKMKQYATPISDTEKSYIGVFSKYVTGYENIKCYTKSGLEEGSYLVSVSLDMRFKGVATAAPGLDFFYVRTKEDKSLYIDNVYSQFNLQHKEQELDKKLQDLINEYEKEPDVAELQESVQTAYEKALSSDKKLKKMVEKTVPNAIKKWAESTAAADSKDETSTNAEKNEDAKTADKDTGKDKTAGETDKKKEETDKKTEAADKNTEETDQKKEKSDQKKEETEKSKSETIYATDNVNIRKKPNESAEVAGSAVKGDSFTRTGTKNGWSIIEYNGAKAYIKSDFVSTEKPAADQPAENPASENTGLSYVPEGTVLTMNTALNIRKSMSETSDKMGTTNVGDTVKVVLSYQEGWTKVEWNGKTGYIKTELLLNN